MILINTKRPHLSGFCDDPLKQIKENEKKTPLSNQSVIKIVRKNYPDKEKYIQSMLDTGIEYRSKREILEDIKKFDKL